MLPKSHPGRMKQKRFQSPSHLAAVRLMPCVVCGEQRSDVDREPHHLLKGPADGIVDQHRFVRGTGLKPGDNWVVPLCKSDHNGSNDSAHFSELGETEFFAKHGIADAPGLARAIWENTGDYAAMCAAVYRFKGKA